MPIFFPLRIPLQCCNIMNHSLSSRFVVEGGKLFLALALFHAFKYKIRCKNCPGNPAAPAFILDEAGSCGKDGKARRQFKCQLSNSKKFKVVYRCPQALYTKYINFAMQQLAPTEFAQIVQNTCQEFSPDQEEYATLQAYKNPNISSSVQHTTPASAQAIQTRLDKRKAEEAALLPSKIARYDQVQGTSNISSLTSTLQHLEVLIEISKIWKEQHQQLSLFLQSSSPRYTPASSSIPLWASPKQYTSADSTPLPSSLPNSLLDQTLLQGPFPVDLLPTASSSPLFEPKLHSDAIIPCTFPEDELTSPASKSADPTPATVRVYIKGVSLDSQFNEQLADSAQKNPKERAEILVEQFRRDAGSRKAIRTQVKAEGLGHLFNSLLNSMTHEPKRSDQQ